MPTPAAWNALTRQAPADRAGNLEAALEAWRVLSSPGHPFEEERLRERVARAYDRCYYPPGFVRQFAAIFGARDRTSELRGLDIPTVVIHGKDDPLIPPMAGEATARAIPGAELVLVDRMGHELPEVVWPEVIEAIVRNARRASVP
jgi:pimeloyl-ACP methyl ester carboxylesterase